MAALRASYSIELDLLHKFNALVPSGERSQVIQRLMAQAVAEREKSYEALAREYETHEDFAQARADAKAFDAAVADGLEG